MLTLAVRQVFFHKKLDATASVAELVEGLKVAPPASAAAHERLEQAWVAKQLMIVGGADLTALQEAVRS